MIIEATPIDAPPAQPDAWWAESEAPDLRFIMLHAIAETACHAGHLDVVRELTDGRQWLALWTGQHRHPAAPESRHLRRIYRVAL